MTQNWKTRLYKYYVSSGQARPSTGSTTLFASRSLYIKYIIKNYVPKNADAHILDIGAGYGAYIYFLKQAGYSNLVGVDTSEEQVQVAHELGVEEIQQADLLQYLNTIEDQVFDAILMIDILEHLEQQKLFDTLDEVYRVLCPGGRCIIHIPNAEGLYGMRVRYGDFTHIQAFTPKSIEQVLQVVGFTGIQCFEDKPMSCGLKGVLRRFAWELGTLYPRILLTIETGNRRFVLSQNMLVVVSK